jgi:hypothetical protein
VRPPRVTLTSAENPCSGRQVARQRRIEHHRRLDPRAVRKRRPLRAILGAQQHVRAVVDQRHDFDGVCWFEGNLGWHVRIVADGRWLSLATDGSALQRSLLWSIIQSWSGSLPPPS